ncbi:mucin-19-like [Betta splendens]|uniref:Mucin-19-like n=1 Tax=Betta splendens TaxID=158456 RepID=A0A6P7LXC6_BETSP|nr:mucin-19-like [Betta splendens]
MAPRLALSRLLHVSALLCAAALSLFTCSASPVLTQVDNGVKHGVLRSMYSSHNQNPPFYLPPETGRETRTSESLTRVPLIIDQESCHQQFSYDQNSPHNKQPGTAAGGAWRGHRGGTRPGGSRSDRPQPRGRYRPVDTDASYSAPQVIRRSPQAEAGSRVYLFPQLWTPVNAPKPPKEAKYPGVLSFKVVDDGSDWTYSDFSFRLHPNRDYWSAALTPRGRCGDRQEATGLRRTPAPRAPSLAQRWDAFIKNHPSPEAQAASVTDSTQRENSHKNAPSYPFKDPQASVHHGATAGFAARGFGSVSSGLIRYEAPSEDAQRAPDSARAHAPTAHPPATSAPPARLRPLPASDRASEGSAPVRDAGAPGSGGPGSERPVAARPASEAGGAARDGERAAPAKRLYGFRGFESPARSAGTEPPVLSKGSLNAVETRDAFTSLGPGFHGASATTRAEAEATPTRPPSAPSGFQNEGTDGGSRVGKDQNPRQVRVSAKAHGLGGFSIRPHEGAEAPVGEPDEPLPQDLEGSEPRGARAEQGPGTDSADLRPAGGPTSEPGGAAAEQARAPHSPTSSVVKATRVTGKRRDWPHGATFSSSAARAAIVRPRKWPVGVPHAHIVGSASFRRFGAGENGFNSTATVEEHRVKREGGDGGTETPHASVSGRKRPVRVRWQSPTPRGKPSALDLLRIRRVSDAGASWQAVAKPGRFQ